MLGLRELNALNATFTNRNNRPKEQAGAGTGKYLIVYREIMKPTAYYDKGGYFIYDREQVKGWDDEGEVEERAEKLRTSLHLDGEVSVEERAA